ncbi:MAG TPA: hypothetical protein VGF56_04315 [Rhizomicrobium sp.]|jgi:general secretion pathway protein N
MSLKPAQIAMIVLCALMAALFFYELLAPPAEYALPDIRLKPRAVTFVPPPSFLPPPVSAFDDINDRPLFLPSRKPIAAPVAAAGSAPAGPPPLPQVALVGVLLDGQNSVAEVKLNGAAFSQAMRVGDVLGGWQIGGIGPDHISLRSGTFTQDVRMDAHAGPPQQQPGDAAPPAPAPAPSKPPGSPQ